MMYELSKTMRGYYLAERVGLCRAYSHRRSGCTEVGFVYSSLLAYLNPLS